MAAIHLREDRSEDRDGLASLWHESWLASGHATEEDPTPDQYRERLATEGRDWRILVACSGDTLVGFVAMRIADGWLRQLFVAPSVQRTGIGTLLLDAARRAMPEGFWLRTDIGNAQARRFYEARGLRFEGETAHPKWGHPVASYRWP